MKRKVFLLLIILTGLLFPFAQETVLGQSSGATQPKIMVVPRIREGENFKKMYDSLMNIQIAIAKINEAFEKRHANIVRFDEVFKQAKENLAINKSSDNAEDFKSLVLQSSGADIYVEAKIDVVRHSARGANSVTIILDGYQKGTGNGLGSKTGFSRMIQTDDIGFLTAQAMDSIAEGFLNLMQSRFDEIVANGQSMYVEFTLSKNSKYDFNTEIGAENELLSQVLRSGIKKIAVKGKFNYTGVVANKMILSDVKFPLKNPKSPDDDYTGEDAYTDIYKYCRSLGIKIDRQISSNNKILITIL